MKALSVRGDYIMDMIAGKKKIEYRTWKTNYRGPLLMCSTAKKVAGAAAGYAICVVNLMYIQYSSWEDLYYCGYEVDAMDYVVKPVEYFSFSQKLDKAVGRMRSEVKEFLTIPIGEGVVKIDIADIYFIEGQRHNVIYHTSRGDYCSRITMKELEEKLAVHNFFRCAKGYLVNMNHVEGFVGSDCVIHNVHIPVSRTRKKEFMNLLLQNLNME